LSKSRKHQIHVGTETERRCNVMAKGFKRNIKASEPYFRTKARADAQKERAVNVMLEFNHACEAHLRAKEALQEAEARTRGQGCVNVFDPLLQAALSDANTQLLRAQSSKDAAEARHKLELEKADQLMMDADLLGRNILIARDIRNSRPYFQEKERSRKLIEECRKRSERVERELMNAKQGYSEALHSLNSISEQVHEERLRRKALKHSKSREKNHHYSRKHSSNSSGLCHKSILEDSVQTGTCQPGGIDDCLQPLGDLRVTRKDEAT